VRPAGQGLQADLERWKDIGRDGTNAATAALSRKRYPCRTELVYTLEEAGHRGRIDGNFTSALGVPTSTAMGAVAKSAQCTDENPYCSSIAAENARSLQCE